MTKQDKRNEELSKFAVIPEKFSYIQNPSKWGFSEIRLRNGPAIYSEPHFLGELIVCLQDRFLITACNVGENGKIADMPDLLDSLEFPS